MNRPYIYIYIYITSSYLTYYIRTHCWTTNFSKSLNLPHILTYEEIPNNYKGGEEKQMGESNMQIMERWV